MKERTYLYSVLEATGDLDAMYNVNVLNLVADKQVITRILRETVKECFDLKLETIMAALDEPKVRKLRVEPGLTNRGISGSGGNDVKEGCTEEKKNVNFCQYGRANLDNSAELVQNEGAVYFDIRGKAVFDTISFKLIYNIEPQRETYESRLGYPIENRMVFYGARIISAQKNTEFFGEDYGEIKKSVTIWIIPLSDKKEDGMIEVLDLMPHTLYGKSTGMLKGGLLQGVLIGFRQGKVQKESSNRLIRFLEVLFGDAPLEVKKEKLVKEHGVVMEIETEEKVRRMCDYASWIRERAEEKGREEGREAGREEGIRSIITVCKDFEASFEETVLKLKEQFHLNETDAEKYMKIYW